MERNTPCRIILVAAIVFLLLIIILPLVNPYGYLVHLDGVAGVIDSNRPDTDPLTWIIYTLGDLFCHQQQERTFMLNGSEMAFCQRDFSMIVGFIIGLVIIDVLPYLSRRVLDKRTPVVGVLLIASTLVEWGLEHALSFDSLPARTATGIVAGIGAALLVQYLFYRQYQSLVA